MSVSTDHDDLAARLIASIEDNGLTVDLDPVRQTEYSSVYRLLSSAIDSDGAQYIIPRQMGFKFLSRDPEMFKPNNAYRDTADILPGIAITDEDTSLAFLIDKNNYLHVGNEASYEEAVRVSHKMYVDAVDRLVLDRITTCEQIAVSRSFLSRDHRVEEDSASKIIDNLLNSLPVVEDFVSLLRNPPERREIVAALINADIQYASFSIDDGRLCFSFEDKDSAFTAIYDPLNGMMQFSDNWYHKTLSGEFDVSIGKYIHWCLEANKDRGLDFDTIGDSNVNLSRKDSNDKPGGLIGKINTFQRDYKKSDDAHHRVGRFAIRKFLKSFHLKKPGKGESGPDITLSNSIYLKSIKAEKSTYQVKIKGDHLQADSFRLSEYLSDIATSGKAGDYVPVLIGKNDPEFGMPDNVTIWDPERGSIISLRQSGNSTVVTDVDGKKAATLQSAGYFVSVISPDLNRDDDESARDILRYHLDVDEDLRIRDLFNLLSDISTTHLKQFHNRTESLKSLYRFPAMFLSIHQAVFDIAHTPLIFNDVENSNETSNKILDKADFLLSNHYEVKNSKGAARIQRLGLLKSLKILPQSLSKLFNKPDKVNVIRDSDRIYLNIQSPDHDHTKEIPIKGSYIKRNAMLCVNSDNNLDMLFDNSNTDYWERDRLIKIITIQTLVNQHFHQHDNKLKIQYGNEFSDDVNRHNVNQSTKPL